jgi:hypothetical protein
MVSLRPRRLAMLVLLCLVSFTGSLTFDPFTGSLHFDPFVLCSHLVSGIDRVPGPRIPGRPPR